LHRSFIPRNRWAEKAKGRAVSYTWGGKEEQKIVENMRKEINDEKDK
jgi:methylsterol monooxygenase